MNLFEDHYMPAGIDIDTAIDQGDERELIAIWDTYHHLQLERRILAGIPDNDHLVRKDSEFTGAEVRRVVAERLTAIAEVTPAQALAANRRLVELLTGRRWYVMRDAREAGDSWSAIGAALGVDTYDACEWYARTITEQETHVGELHDATRARAALGDYIPLA
jgi:hypothetical protein